MKALKIYSMNNCDWWADYSLEDAIKNYSKFVCMEEDEACDEPSQLDDKEMNNYRFCPDPYDEPDSNVRTFQEELDKNIKEGNIKPFFFASTEQ